jgi:hypothetical protein
MITTGHLLIGGALGATASTWLPAPTAVPVALGLGILSHHLLDLLPHTDAATFYPDARRIPWFAIFVIVLENLLGLGLTSTLLVTQYTTWAFAAGALGGVLPDLCDEIPLWQERFRRSYLGGVWHRWHHRLHCADMSNAWTMGLMIDFSVVGAGLWFLWEGGFAIR